MEFSEVYTRPTHPHGVLHLHINGNGSYVTANSSMTSLNDTGSREPLFSPSTWRVFQAVYVTLLLLVAVAIVSANLLVVILFVRSRRLRGVKHWFVMSLVFSDIQVGLIDTPIWVYIIMHPQNMSRALCVFNWTYPHVIFLASVFSILGITVDRFVCIRWPLRHRVLVTKRRTAISIVLIWAVSVLVAFIPTMDPGVKIATPTEASVHMCSHVITLRMQYFKTSALVLVLPPIVIIIVLYACIVKIVTDHVANREKIRLTVANCHKDTSDSEMESLSGRDKRKSRRDPKSTISAYKKITYAAKTFRVFSIVLSCILISWCPLLIALDLAASCTHCHKMALFIVVIVCNLLSNCTSAINPWLYTLRTQEFNDELRKLLASFGLIKFAGGIIDSSIVSSRS